MSLTSMQRRGLALFLFFFMPGLCMASWVTRTPAIRDRLHASTAEMGMVLFGLSLGSMGGILSSGWLTRRLGTRPVIITGMAMVTAAMLIIACGAALSQSVLVAAGLFFIGVGMGSAEVAINIEGATVERLLDRPVMSMLHGCYSLGTLAGAAIGIGLTAMDFPIQWHLLLIAGIALPAVPWGLRSIPAGTGKAQATGEGHRRSGSMLRVMKNRQLLMIGVIVLAMALAEGSASDWLPLLMVDGHGFNATSGSLIYAGFALAMTAGRFGGSMFQMRFGRVNVVRGSALLGATGLALIIFADNALVAGGAVVLWGLGASLGFPLTISAAGDSEHFAAERVSIVATLGYVAFLVGPPLLGFLGQHFGLRSAMILVLAMVALAIVLAPAMRESSAQATARP